MDYSKNEEGLIEQKDNPTSDQEMDHPNKVSHSHPQNNSID